MGRDYSHGACCTCKQRRKKCDEKTPICGACSRLNIPCSYSSNKPYQNQTRGWRDLGVLDMPTALHEAKVVATTVSEDDAEYSVLNRIPSLLQLFFHPVATASAADLQPLWQMMYRNSLVRNATIAAFSPLAGQTDRFRQLGRVSYGRTLKSLRAELSRSKLDSTEIALIQLAICFSGIMRSIGPEMFGDPLEHWKALTALVGRSDSLDFRAKGPWSGVVYIMLLESLMYHLVALSMFSRLPVSTYEIYSRCQVYESICTANPDGPYRISRSPLLCGQYDMYHVGLRIITLHRCADDKKQPALPDDLNDMELTLRSRLLRLDEDLNTTASRNAKQEHRAAAIEMHIIMYNSLIACIIALRAASTPTIAEFDRVISETLEIFWVLPVLDINYSMFTWALVLLGCGIRGDTDFDRYVGQFKVFEQRLKPGHRERVHSFLARLARTRALSNADHITNTAEFAETSFPIAMSLLRKEGGVLS